MELSYRRLPRQSDSPIAESTLPRVAFASVYLDDPIEHFHHITFVGRLGGSGKIWLNPNQSQVNRFGDAEGDAAIPTTVRDVKITRDNAIDPHHLHRDLYTVEGAVVHSLSLVVPSNRVESCRLVYTERDRHMSRPIALERLVWEEELETCSYSDVGYGIATYHAQQFPNFAVLITASGCHAAGGYRVFFEQVSDSNPPQFKLLHIKPHAVGPRRPSPFNTEIQFAGTRRIEGVIVHDANGEHPLPVEQVSEMECG